MGLTKTHLTQTRDKLNALRAELKRCERLLVLFMQCRAIANGLRVMRAAFAENETVKECLGVWDRVREVFVDEIALQRDAMIMSCEERETLDDAAAWDLEAGADVLPDVQVISDINMRLGSLRT